MVIKFTFVYVEGKLCNPTSAFVFVFFYLCICVRNFFTKLVYYYINGGEENRVSPKLNVW